MSQDSVAGSPAVTRADIYTSLRKKALIAWYEKDNTNRGQRVVGLDLSSFGSVSISAAQVAVRNRQMQALFSTLLGIDASIVRVVRDEFVVVGDLVMWANGVFSAQRTQWHLCGVEKNPGVITGVGPCTIYLGSGYSGDVSIVPALTLSTLGEVIDRFSQVDFSADTVLPYLE